MSTSITLDKTDFIKFNVSPDFKKIVSAKARSMGLTLSELGRMLFGAYVTEIISPETRFSKRFLKLAEEAEDDHRSNKGVLLKSPKDIQTYFKSLK